MEKVIEKMRVDLRLKSFCKRSQTNGKDNRRYKLFNCPYCHNIVRPVK